MKEATFLKCSGMAAEAVEHAIGLTAAQAARIASPLRGGARDEDEPITVCVGGTEERWTSRYLCYHYYSAAGIACAGSSEGGRYSEVAYGVLFGEPYPTDGIPVRRPLGASRKCA